MDEFNDLEPVFDGAILQTVQKRQRYPVQIKANLGKAYNAEYDSLVNSKVELNAAQGRVDNLTEGSIQMLNDVTHIAEQTFYKMADLTKNLSVSRDKADGLLQVIDMKYVVERSKTDRVVTRILEDESECKLAESITPLRRRLQNGFDTPGQTSKSVRSSALVPSNSLNKTDFKEVYRITKKHKVDEIG